MKKSSVVLFPLFLLVACNLFAQCPQQAEIISHDQDTIKSCDLIRLEARKNNSWEYEWAHEGTVIEWRRNNTLTAFRTGKYVLKVSNNAGCISYDSIYIEKTKLVDVTTPPIVYGCFPGVQLKASLKTGVKDINVRWLYDTDYFSDNSLSPFYTLSESNLRSGNVAFIVLEISSGNCINQDTINVKLNDNCPILPEITGYVYYDLNQNGIKDPSERGIKNILVSTGLYNTITDTSGLFRLHLPDETYTLSVKYPGYYIPIEPASGQHEFSVTGESLSNVNFGLYKEPVRDLNMTVSAGRARPGIEHPVTASVKNSGDYTETYTPTITSAPTFTFASATDGGVFDEECSCVKWENERLEPGRRKKYQAYFNVPTDAQMGDRILDKAEVTTVPDEYSIENNADSTYTFIVNSYDPNDKQVNAYPNNGTYISENSTLDYTIRFQNTGTDTAYTVVLKDSIDTNLDLSTFKPLGSSHSYRLSLSGQLLTIVFDNIMLPDSNVNEPASNGFFKYRIEPVSAIEQGTVIKNYAGIYFDYNEPIYTNTTECIVKDDVILATTRLTSANSIKIHPNPAHDILYVSSENEIKRISLLTLTGEQVLSTSKTAINLADRKPGIYFVRIETNNEVELRKVVVK